MVFAFQSSNPSCHAQELAVHLAAPEDSSLQVGVVSGMQMGEVCTSDQLTYSDYWQRFQEGDSGAADLGSASVCKAPDHMPLRKVIKVL